MRVVYKEVPTTIDLSNADEILDYAESLNGWLSDFIEETEKLKSSEITAKIEIRSLNEINIKYDVVEIARRLEKYRSIIKNLDKELDQFVEEVNNINFNKAPSTARQRKLERSE